VVNKSAFEKDLLFNYEEMKRFDVGEDQANYYLPLYEW
jgi:hypothetical protein